ncbi:MAG: amylo-alpha-1,6-glucosidase, partial [Chitinophagales bacterium]
SFDAGILSVQMNENATQVFISLNDANFNNDPNWYHHFEYAAEKERGLDHQEDLFSPGVFILTLREGEQIGIIVSTEIPAEKNAFALFDQEMQRRHSLVAPAKDAVVKQLLLAADQFIVQRDHDLKTVIAGYHWFTDWSRDTMIALPGLCLVTGRFNDAKKILLAFAKNESKGMLPNRFQDRGMAPEYNNADGTLWYFIAIHQYLLAGGDKKFVLQELLPVLTSIINWHYKGTRYHIHVSEDHLLFAGEPGVQLTWMDAKVDDWVLTPRIGKAVEINALWYNALRIYTQLLKLKGENKEAKRFRKKAKQTKKQFIKAFWSDELNYLYDVVRDDHNDRSLRPNQLFALGLPFQLVKGKKAKLILKAVQEHLVTPLGLRSLSPDDTDYSGMYEGNIVQRDSAYHQGTVWSWLTGIYIDALFKIYGKGARTEALNTIDQLIQHLNEGGIGSVSEIFDGDAPHLPRGCIAQAWSVSELLRVIAEYDLFSANHK